MLINERSDRIEKAFKESVDDTFNMCDVTPAHGRDFVETLDIENRAARTYDSNIFLGGIYDEDESEGVDIEEDEIVSGGTESAELALSRMIDPALIKLQLYGTREISSRLSSDNPYGSSARRHYPSAGLKKKDSVVSSGKGSSGNGSVSQVQDDRIASDKPPMSRQHSEASMNKRHSSVSLTDSIAPSQSQIRPNPSSSNSLFELENHTEARRFSLSKSHHKKPLTMVVSHFVKWERTLEFENWLKELFEAM